MDNGIFSLIASAQQGNRYALERIVSENDGLVWSVVRRFSGRGYESDDLYQLGCIGLVKAVQKFDFSKNVQFSTYAVPMILGEIRKFLRDDGTIKVSRSIKELAMKIKYVADEISKETGKEATVSDIASKLGISTEAVAEAMAASASPVSLYQPISEDSELSLIDTLSDDDKYEKIIDCMTLRTATATLPEREQNLIFLRYYKNETQTEVAKKMGISQVQVSRIEKKILEKLRKEII